MDQDSTKGSDKRNWRERLGIGTAQASASKDLPRISEEFAPHDDKVTAAPLRPGSTRPAAVKPAPMAPRPAGRPAPNGPVAPEKLAERLRSQREAQAKLAEQRVQVARQRAEQVPASADASTSAGLPTAAAAATKPKFTFAEDGDGNASVVAVQAPGAPAPRMTPARQPLGASPVVPGFQPRPPAAGAPPLPGGQTRSPPLPRDLGQPPLPGYRPFEQPLVPPPLPRGAHSGPGSGPMNGYAPPPRLGAPGRTVYGTGHDYGTMAGGPGAAMDPRLIPPRGRMPSSRGTSPQYDDAIGDDAYYPEQMPAPRGGRRSAADYRQAYRDMEHGFEDEAPRSRGPWILLSMLVLTLGFAMAGVWYYQTYFKPTITANSSGEQVPVVQPPAAAPIAKPEQPAASAQPAKPAGQKRIYDRIVGDQEVLSGQLAPAEEVPLAPPAESQVPEPSLQLSPAAPSGEDAAPLPIPPPLGENETQGSLPVVPPSQSTALSTPQAGESQAAIVKRSEPAVPPPAPGETVEPATAAATAEESEIIEPVIAPAPKPSTAPKSVAAKKTKPQSLGTEPVVLVPPAGGAEANEAVSAVSAIEAPAESLYSSEEEAVASTAPVTSTAPVKKKKKTIADLFNNAAEDTAQFTQSVEPGPEPPTAAKPQPAQVAKKQAKPAPAEIQVASAGGYVAQLASFRSRQEASAEFARLQVKHSALLRGATPIISAGVVGGSTRYRLAVGGFASKEEASLLCNKLIAAGERDCLAKLQ